MAVFKITVVEVAMLCSLMETYPHFEGIRFLHLQDRILSYSKQSSLHSLRNKNIISHRRLFQFLLFSTKNSY